MQAIILAGGFGTRLSGLLKNTPKPMAKIHDRPLLSIILDNIIRQGVTSIILSVGYKHNKIMNYFGNMYKTVPIIYSIESTPLGTGGAIKEAMEIASDESILVLNGDSYFDINFKNFFIFHDEFKSDISIGIKKVEKTDRYGTVILKKEKIVDFKEKHANKNAFINCGIYIIKRKIFKNIEHKKKSFSFEKEILEINYNLLINGYISKGKFIDIGVPEDLQKAGVFFKDLNNG